MQHDPFREIGYRVTPRRPNTNSWVTPQVGGPIEVAIIKIAVTEKSFKLENVKIPFDGFLSNFKLPPPK